MSQDTKREILAAAAVLFADKGYEATSLREIAEPLGITKAALYYHFRSKDELAIALTEPLIEDLEQLVADTADTAALLSGYVRVLLAHHQVVGIISRDLSLLHHPMIGQRLERQTDTVRSVLGDGLPSTDQRLLASAALGAVWRPVVQLDHTEVAPRSQLLVEAAQAVLRLGHTTTAATR